MYRRLLDRLLRLFFPSFMFLASPLGLREGAGLVLAAKDKVRGTIRLDSLAVFNDCVNRKKEDYVMGSG